MPGTSSTTPVSAPDIYIYIYIYIINNKKINIDILHYKFILTAHLQVYLDYSF